LVFSIDRGRNEQPLWIALKSRYRLSRLACVASVIEVTAPGWADDAYGLHFPIKQKSLEPIWKMP